MKPNYEHQVLDGRFIEVTFFSDNKGSTFVGMAKRWPQLLNRGLISHFFLQLFQDFDYWLLNPISPISAYKFSQLTSIHFLTKLIGRI